MARIDDFLNSFESDHVVTLDDVAAWENELSERDASYASRVLVGWTVHGARRVVRAHRRRKRLLDALSRVFDDDEKMDYAIRFAFRSDHFVDFCNLSAEEAALYVRVWLEYAERPDRVGSCYNPSSGETVASVRLIRATGGGWWALNTLGPEWAFYIEEKRPARMRHTVRGVLTLAIKDFNGKPTNRFLASVGRLKSVRWRAAARLVFRMRGWEEVRRNELSFWKRVRELATAEWNTWPQNEAVRLLSAPYLAAALCPPGDIALARVAAEAAFRLGEKYGRQVEPHDKLWKANVAVTFARRRLRRKEDEDEAAHVGT